MSQQWFYTKDGKSQLGPVSSAELQALAKAGKLLPTDMVWTQRMTQWKAASEIKGLFANLESSQKSPPPPLPAKYVQPTGAITPPAKAKPLGQRLGTRAKIGLIAGGAMLGLFMLCCGGGALWMMIGGGGWFKSKALEVTAKEIHEAYQANALAADKMYKGKMVQIEGVVDSSPNREGRGLYVRVSGNASSFRC